MGDRALPGGDLDHDRQARIVYVNPRFSTVTGYGRTDVLHRNPRFLKSPLSDVAAHRALWAALAAGSDWRGSLCNCRADGSIYEAEVAISPVRDATDAVSHFVAVYGEPRAPSPRAEQPLAAAADAGDPPPAGAAGETVGEAAGETAAGTVTGIVLGAAGTAGFGAVVDAIPYGMMIERDGRAVLANRACVAMFGYARPADVEARGGLPALVAADDRPRVQRYWRAHAGRIPAPKAFECRGLKKDGSIIWLDTRVQAFAMDGTPCKPVDHRRRHLVQDLRGPPAPPGELRPGHQPAQPLAGARPAGACDRHRPAAVPQGGRAVHRHRRLQDDQRHLRPRLGDRFLRQLGERIRLCVREEDTVARIGGDEFSIVLPDLRSVADAEGVARKIIESVGAPFKLDGREAFVGASIGITISPEDGTDADPPRQRRRRGDVQGQDLRAQPAAVLHARTERPGDQPQPRQGEAAHGAGARRAACPLPAHRRPRRRPHHRRRGAAALARPGAGHLDAEHFIRVAEETGLIVPIGAWTMTMACRDAARWRRAGGDGFFVSVNVCSREFRARTLAEDVVRGLRDNDLPVDSLHLEFGESVLMMELPQIVAAVRTLASAGVRLAVDDFGSGYSSLASLSRFPLDTVKIDGSLTRRIVTSPVQASLVEAIVAFAHRLGLRVTAEGVETAEQLAMVQARQVRRRPGLAVQRALTAEGIEALLAARCPAPPPLPGGQ